MRVKRTEAQMLEALNGDTLAQAMYVKERVRKLEEKIAELLASVPSEATELALKGREHLGRYLP